MVCDLLPDISQHRINQIFDEIDAAPPREDRMLKQLKDKTKVIAEASPTPAPKPALPAKKPGVNPKDKKVS
jgi:hypothetical protein